MPTYKIDVDNVKPDIRNGGYVASIPLNVGNARNINSVLCGLTSGEATFNFSFDDDISTSSETITDFDDFSAPLLWHLRSEDLDTVYSDSDSVEEFWSYTDHDHMFYQGTAAHKPIYYDDRFGINNSATTLSNGSLYFQGYASNPSHMDSEDSTGTENGTFELGGTSSFTIVTVAGTKSAGSYRPFLGTKVTSASIHSLYGDWGRFRMRQKSFQEYTHGSAIAASNQIRVARVENTSNTSSDLDEYINGTREIDSTISINRQEDWIWNMLGGAEYIVNGNTYRILWGGGISEMLLFDGALTSSERELIEGHLAHKYGVEEYLPSAHPYKTTDPNPSGPTFELTSDASLTSSTNTVKTYSTSKQIFHGKQVHLFLPRAQNPGNINFAVTAS